MKTAALLIAAMLATSAQAQVIFSDGFETSPLALNGVPTGWSITNGGTTDVIGPGLYGELCGGTGSCVDLDGSSSMSAVLSRSFNLNAGTTYTLSFDIAGNRRGAGTETGTVSFGSSVLNYTLTDSSVNAPYQTLSLTFKPLATIAYTVSFANNGGDNMGAIIDNVVIMTAVPEPASAALMLLGLGGVALFKRRRD